MTLCQGRFVQADHHSTHYRLALDMATIHSTLVKLSRGGFPDGQRWIHYPQRPARNQTAPTVPLMWAVSLSSVCQSSSIAGTNASLLLFFLSFFPFFPVRGGSSSRQHCIPLPTYLLTSTYLLRATQAFGREKKKKNQTPASHAHLPPSHHIACSTVKLAAQQPQQGLFLGGGGGGWARGQTWEERDEAREGRYDGRQKRHSRSHFQAFASRGSSLVAPAPRGLLRCHRDRSRTAWMKGSTHLA